MPKHTCYRRRDSPAVAIASDRNIDLFGTPRVGNSIVLRFPAESEVFELASDALLDVDYTEEAELTFFERRLLEGHIERSKLRVRTGIDQR